MDCLKETVKKLDLTVLMIGLLFSFNSFAGTFIPPTEIPYLDKIYKIAYKNAQPNGRAVYEYTTDNEPVEKWTTLITLNYSKGLKAKPAQWLEVMKKQLKNDGVLSDQALYEKESNGFVRFIFPPTKDYPEYESNAHKSLHIDACDGILVFQYATKYLKDTKLDIITDGNEKAIKQLEDSKWIPDCN